MIVEPIHATSLATLLGKNDQVGQNEYAKPVDLDLAAAAGLPSGAVLSGEALRMVLVSRAGAGVDIIKPAGTVYLLTTKPTVATGDQEFEDGTAWGGAWAAVAVATTDWKGDTSGAMATILETAVPFHALSKLYALWLHGDESITNAEAGNDETIELKVWFRRLS